VSQALAIDSGAVSAWWLGITALRGYMGSGNASAVMAAVAIAILPVLVIFLLAQRWFITGVTRTGLKG
jgi:multiple sugar transport system permease protein